MTRLTVDDAASRDDVHSHVSYRSVYLIAECVSCLHHGLHLFTALG